MEISYNEMEKKLSEVYKIINAMEYLVKIGEKNKTNVEYMSVPISKLKIEINNLNEKITRLKENMRVKYDEDINYIDELILQNGKCEIKKGREWIGDDVEEEDKTQYKESKWAKYQNKRGV